MISAICRNCGQPFEFERGKRGRPKEICKHNCGQTEKAKLKRASRPPKNATCEFCAGPFTYRRGIKRFCSARCRYEAQRRLDEIARGKPIPRRPPRIPFYTCGHCRKQFKPTQSDRTKFCSRQCAFIYRSPAAKAAREAAGQ